MYLYCIASDVNSEDHIFAESFDEAAEFAVIWWKREGIELGKFSVAQVNPKYLDDLCQRHLKIALNEGVKGMGDYIRSKGWVVEPIEIGSDQPFWNPQVHHVRDD